MKPTTIIYWTRAFTGVVAGLLSTLLSTLGEISFLNGVTIALLVYIITYYIYKPLFLTKVEKPSKILTTGVGVYFLTWIVAWIIFYTLIFHIYS